MGAEIDVVPAYRTLQPQECDDDFVRRLQEGWIDVVTFTSSSTVKNFLDLLGADLHPLLQSVKIACIGPITRKTAEEHGLKVDIVPNEFTVEGLTEAITDYFSRETA